MPSIISTLILVSILGGTMSAAAVHAMPGNLLYTFKTNIAERVQETFAFSPQRRANVDILLIQKRLDEVESLAKKNKLNTNIQARLLENISAHANDVLIQITALDSQNNLKDAADAAARLQAMLAQKMSALTQAQASTGEDTALTPIVSRVRTLLAAASTLSTGLSAKAASMQK